jgi:hypothetical protein
MQQLLPAESVAGLLLQCRKTTMTTTMMMTWFHQQVCLVDGAEAMLRY